MRLTRFWFEAMLSYFLFLAFKTPQNDLLIFNEIGDFTGGLVLKKNQSEEYM